MIVTEMLEFYITLHHYTQLPLTMPLHPGTHIMIRMFLLMLLLASLAFSSSNATNGKFSIDISLLDLPYTSKNNFLSIRQLSPGMPGSLALTSSLTQAQKYYTWRLFFNPDLSYSWQQKALRGLGFGVTDALVEGVLFFCPIGPGWLHEEWHRAVMNSYNISSFNDMNTFPFGQTLVSVNSIADTDLSRLKQQNNSDFLRLMTAGLEAQYELVKNLQKVNFFYKLNLPLSISYFMNTLNNIAYVATCSDPSSDSMTIEMEKEEGASIKKRDFTGLDFIAWAYDLSRPDEPYSSRGIHPSGSGIRRYRRTSDLTRDELEYLKKMGSMQLLNLVSPSLFFINSIQLTENLRGNFSLFHYLTPFGYDLGANIFTSFKNTDLFFALHNYHNNKTSTLGIETSLINHPLTISGVPFSITPTVYIWMQPQDLQFKTSEVRTGGKIELSVASLHSKSIHPYITLGAKSEGWVAGDIDLGSSLNVKAGLELLVR